MNNNFYVIESHVADVLETVDTVDSFSLTEILGLELHYIEAARERALVRSKSLLDAGMPENAEFYRGISMGLVAAVKLLDLPDRPREFDSDDWEFIVPTGFVEGEE